MEDCVLIEKNCLYVHAEDSDEKIMKAVQRGGSVDVGRTKESILGTRQEKLGNKNMHTIFFRSTEFRDQKTWSWLKKRRSEESN